MKRPFDVHTSQEHELTKSECGLEMSAMRNAVLVDVERFLSMGDVAHLWIRCGKCFRELFKAMPNN